MCPRLKCPYSYTNCYSSVVSCYLVVSSFVSPTKMCQIWIWVGRGWTGTLTQERSSCCRGPTKADGHLTERTLDRTDTWPNGHLSGSQLSRLPSVREPPPSVLLSGKQKNTIRGQLYWYFIDEIRQCTAIPFQSNGKFFINWSAWSIFAIISVLSVSVIRHTCVLGVLSLTLFI